MLNKKKQADNNESAVRDLMRVIANKTCFDCQEKVYF
jgi:hypothetical protein